MNYLAHLHIADHCQSSLLGNLLGDFVRGNPESQFSSGIALDMFWDHCLAKRWSEFHTMKLDGFCQFAQKNVESDAVTTLPESFVRTSTAMWEGRWLESYQHIENIEFALRRMSSRRPTMKVLAECFPYIESNYHQLDEVFSAFYPEILTASKRF